jgi:hypothetical protein
MATLHGRLMFHYVVVEQGSWECRTVAQGEANKV